MLTSEDTARALASLAAEPQAVAVILDLDGTLAPIVEHPEDVRVPPAIRELVERVRDRYATTMVASGRSLTQLRTVLDIPGIVYSGNHGRETVLADGTALIAAEPEGARAAMRAFVGRWDPDALRSRGIWLEDKGATLTFHYRTAPDPLAAERWLSDLVAPRAAAAGLNVEPGRMSLEVHPTAQTNKGTAVAAMLDLVPAIRRAVSLGDDRTDTTVWHMLRTRVRAGTLATGLGICVASDETADTVLRAADARVDGIAGTERVLRTLVAPPPAARADP